MGKRAATVATQRKLFLRWALVNVLFLIALIVAAISYSGPVPTAAKLVITAVFTVYVCASVFAGVLSWKEQKDRDHHLSEAIGLCPMVAMLGTVSGFLIALSGSTTDTAHIQDKVLGASSGLLATFVGISCAIVLVLLRLPLRDLGSRR